MNEKWVNANRDAKIKRECIPMNAKDIFAKLMVMVSATLPAVSLAILHSLFLFISFRFH